MRWLLLLLPLVSSLVQRRVRAQEDSTAAGDGAEMDQAPNEGELRTPQKPDPWVQLYASAVTGLNRPKERYCHASDRCGYFMVSHGGGGFTTDRLDVILSDTWRFDIRSNTWDAASPTRDGPARIYHSLSTVIDTFSSKENSNSNAASECTMLVFGGASADSSQENLIDENSLYAFTLSQSSSTAPVTGRWKPLYPSGILPDARNEHISIAHGGSLYVFGGMSGSSKDSVKQFNDVWKYSYVKGSEHGAWEYLSAEASKEHGMPNERFSLAGAYASAGVSAGSTQQESSNSEPSMIIFGGSYFDIRPSSATIVLLDDLWSFGLVSHTWKLLSPRGRSMQRTYMSLVVSSNAVFVFGGMSQRSNERGREGCNKSSWKITPSNSATCDRIAYLSGIN